MRKFTVGYSRLNFDVLIAATQLKLGSARRYYGELHGSLFLPPRTLVLDDAQVEAWHEDHHELIDLGGAFSSRGPFTLTNSNLTVSWTQSIIELGIRPDTVLHHH